MVTLKSAISLLPILLVAKNLKLYESLSVKLNVVFVVIAPLLLMMKSVETLPSLSIKVNDIIVAPPS